MSDLSDLAQIGQSRELTQTLWEGGPGPGNIKCLSSDKSSFSWGRQDLACYWSVIRDCGCHWLILVTFECPGVLFVCIRYVP